MQDAQSLKNAVNSAMGEGTMMVASDPSLVVTYLPTGILPIDTLLDGGLPRGRVTEIFGDYSTLKSYIALKAIAETQKSGGIGALVDTEHAFDPEWAWELGVDTDELIYMTPTTGEQAVDATEILVRKDIDLVVWDSVAATLPQTEEAKRSEDKVQPARQAALFSRAMRKLTAANSSTSLLFINQTRMNVGVVYGSPETTPGGRALPFYASYRIALRKAGRQTMEAKAWDGDVMKTVKETYGQKIRASIEKSKLSAPHRDTYFVFDYTTGGIDEAQFLMAWGLEHGHIVRSGAMWNLKGSKKKIRGKDAFKEWLLKNPKAMAKLEAKCRGQNLPDKSKDETPNGES